MPARVASARRAASPTQRYAASRPAVVGARDHRAELGALGRARAGAARCGAGSQPASSPWSRSRTRTGAGARTRRAARRESISANETEPAL